CLSLLHMLFSFFFFFSSRRRHTRSDRDWSSDVCSSDLTRRAHSAHHPPLQDERQGAPGTWVARFWRLSHANALRRRDLVRTPSKIGRASCRERVEIAVGGVGVKEKDEGEQRSSSYGSAT